jgi:hypothetical protein
MTHLMRHLVASRIMPRTTLNLDGDVLRALKRRQRREGKPLGALVSEMLAPGLREEAPVPPPLRWTSRRMRARVDLEDKEAVRRALDEA